eukprot:m.324851 g.324851  ORF g.324851 m.324851 type:complete len:449 (-) comp19731_c2_seq1:331-1677(-)
MSAQPLLPVHQHQVTPQHQQFYDQLFDTGSPSSSGSMDSSLASTSLLDLDDLLLPTGKNQPQQLLPTMDLDLASFASLPVEPWVQDHNADACVLALGQPPQPQHSPAASSSPASPASSDDMVLSMDTDIDASTAALAAATALSVSEELKRSSAGKYKPNSVVQKLTEEEKRLLVAEQGWTMGFETPLTKAEESDLKKKLRKVRNKQSAQRSRKKQAEYTRSLEERVNATSKVCVKLQQELRVKEHQNRSLAKQLEELKKLVSETAASKVRSGAGTLMLLAMSFALMCSPPTDMSGAAAPDGSVASPSSFAGGNGFAGARTLKSVGGVGLVAPDFLPDWTQVEDDGKRHASSMFGANDAKASSSSSVFSSLLSVISNAAASGSSTTTHHAGVSVPIAKSSVASSVATDMSATLDMDMDMDAVMRDAACPSEAAAASVGTNQSAPGIVLM